jgi:hypothetical protein
MITACPHCDSFVPMNVDLAVHSANLSLNCPCCEQAFKPFDPLLFEAEMQVEAIKDNLVIEKSLQNTTRWFEDC